MSGAISKSQFAVGMVLCALFAVVLAISYPARAQAAQPPVGLGTAGSFAVLGGSTVTNTGPTVLNGDLGVHPGAAITGFPPGTVNGATHAADAAAGQAKSDLVTAYNDAAGRTPAASVAGDIGGQSLNPGVYKSTSSLLLTGDVTLNAQGNANAVFIFQVGSALTTATGSRVRLINGANPCNVYWQVGSSATIGTTTSFNGNILALTSISANTSATFNGRLLARNGAVTLDTNTVTSGVCTPSTDDGSGSGPGGGGGTGGGGGGGAVFQPGLGPATPGGPGSPSRCVGNRSTGSVTGTSIRRVVFSIGGKKIATVSHAPFEVSIVVRGKSRTVRAHVTFTGGTPAANLKLVFRPCAKPSRRVAPRPLPPRTPPHLTA